MKAVALILFGLLCLAEAIYGFVIPTMPHAVNYGPHDDEGRG